MQMPGRTLTAANYRYGFNGQEKDNEISGEGNAYTAEFWEYDSRIGRRWNVDPVVKPWESPYVAFNNNPNIMIDPDGRDGTPYKIKKGNNLSKIAKRAGTTVKELQAINDIKNPNKIKTGDIIQLFNNPSAMETEMFGNPEQDFKDNPLTGYNNPDNGKYAYSVTASTKELGDDFVSNIGKVSTFQNTVIMGGPLLNEVQNLPSVQNLIRKGIENLETKKFQPGEFFKSSYTMSSISETDGRRIYKHVFGDIVTKQLSDNYFFSAENFLGSYGFSMRVTGDGKQIAIAVYDSKSIRSLSDHRGWLEKRLPDIAPTYQRYL